jgi:hypothetical protein
MCLSSDDICHFRTILLQNYKYVLKIAKILPLFLSVLRN